ncbi:MAG: hypothetical protein V3V22_01145 [Methylococcales bacterium]
MKQLFTQAPDDAKAYPAYGVIDQHMPALTSLKLLFLIKSGVIGIS